MRHLRFAVLAVVAVALCAAPVAVAHPPDKDGGALSKMLLPFKLGGGGPVAGGGQFMPWIHVDDVVGSLGRTNDGVGLVAKSRAGPVGQVDRNRLMTGLPQSRGHQVPVGAAAARPVNQDEGHLGIFP